MTEEIIQEGLFKKKDSNKPGFMFYCIMNDDIDGLFDELTFDKLMKLGEKYKVKNFDEIEDYLEHINEIRKDSSLDENDKDNQINSDRTQICSLIDDLISKITGISKKKLVDYVFDNFIKRLRSINEELADKMFEDITNHEEFSEKFKVFDKYYNQIINSIRKG